MSRNFKQALTSFIVVALIIIFAVWVFGNIQIKSKQGDANIARCKSLQGEYGGGKCFKDGKEV